MKVHDLKCVPSSYYAIQVGDKKAEFRLNDRDYRPADLLLLRPYVSAENPDDFWGDYPNPEHVGQVVEGCLQLVRVTHVLAGPMFGVPEGYVVMSIERVAVRSIE